MKYIVVFLLALGSTLGMAQRQDSVLLRRNTIKINLISNVLFRNSAVLSYERVTKPNQSFGIMAGAIRFPTVADFGNYFKVTDDVKKTGYVVGGEYRFYLKQENKRAAPHGVFIGPYISYYHFTNDRDLTFTSPDGMTTQNALLKTDIGALNIGAQLGYQFVIKNRWTIDLVFIGPSVSNYALKINLSENFSASDEEILANEIVAALVDRFPLVEDLLKEETVSLRGKSQAWSAGFRYQLNVGYHFGRKKK